MPNTALLLLFALAVAALFLFARSRREARDRFIQEYAFPKGLDGRLLKQRPELDAAQVAQVFAGLKQYFRIALAANKRMVAMPSQVVDELWHEFILYTRNYQAFSSRAFGRYLHHTPAEAMSAVATQHAALRRAWQLACRQEGIDPRHPQRLPLLFALDGMLGIADGFHYVPDCKGQAHSASSTAHCGADLGAGSDSSGSDSSGSDSSDSDGGSSCSGGCGGD
jgi:hypothetical protein